MPEEFKSAQEKPKTDWTQLPDATYLALAVLIGAWQDKSQCDLEAITQLLGISYDEWLKKAREILHCADSPLSLKNGIWKVVNCQVPADYMVACERVQGGRGTKF